MSQLIQPGELQKIDLPLLDGQTDEQDWVVMEISALKAGDVQGVDETMNDGDSMYLMLANRIKEWSYTNADGSQADITLSNIKLLPMEHFTHLASKLKNKGALSDEAKKESSSTSSTVETTTTEIPITLG